MSALRGESVVIEPPIGFAWSAKRNRGSASPLSNHPFVRAATQALAPVALLLVWALVFCWCVMFVLFAVPRRLVSRRRTPRTHVRTGSGRSRPR